MCHKNNDFFFNTIKEYIVNEYQDKQPVGYNLNIKEWQCNDFQGQYPQQQNGFDCGVYSLKCVRSLCQNTFPFYKPEDIYYIRRQIMFEIYKQKIMF